VAESTGVEVLETVIEFFKESRLMGEKQVQFEKFKVLPKIATRKPRRKPEKPEPEKPEKPEPEKPEKPEPEKPEKPEGEGKA
jgi:hypothetical protein